MFEVQTRNHRRPFELLPRQDLCRYRRASSSTLRILAFSLRIPWALRRRSSNLERDSSGLGAQDGISHYPVRLTIIGSMFAAYEPFRSRYWRFDVSVKSPLSLQNKQSNMQAIKSSLAPNMQSTSNNIESRVWYRTSQEVRYRRRGQLHSDPYRVCYRQLFAR